MSNKKQIWQGGPYYAPVGDPDVRVANETVWLRFGSTFRVAFTGRPDEDDATLYFRWKSIGMKPVT